MTRQFVIVGGLLSMTRAEAKRAIEAGGGLLVERVSRNTTALVIGDRGPQTRRDGGTLTQLARARRLLVKGCSIEIWSEEQWLSSLPMFAGTRGICRQFTAGQIAQTLSVPRATLDRWLDAELVQPIESSAVPLFDFSQVVAARTLVELAAAGVSLARIRRSLQQLQTWLPSVNRTLAELCLTSHSRRLAVRTEDGRLAETSGQYLLDFDLDSPAPVVTFERTETLAEAFQRARAYEEQQRLEEAAGIYRAMLDQGAADAAVLFNYGNVLYGLDDLSGAMDQYRRATDLDPCHADAWNNFANVLAELDRLDEATEVYERTLRIDPSRADTHFNLAQTLLELERDQQAELHWKAYLAFDTDSSWADYARERLAQADKVGGGR